MTCGEQTEKACLESVSKERAARLFQFQEVRNITPAVTALNAMFAQCETPYLVPLDSDMILYPGFIDRIRTAVEARQTRNWHSILFPLWDTLTQEKILALKVFHMDVMRHVLFRDDPCPDITHYQDMEALGLECVNLYNQEPIGDHVVDGHYFCFAKYRDLYMVHRAHPQSYLPQHFKGGNNIKERAKNHYDFFVKLLEETGHMKYLYCIAGMVVGLTSPLKYTSKDLSDREIPFKPGEAFMRFEEWHKAQKGDRIFL